MKIRKSIIFSLTILFLLTSCADHPTVNQPFYSTTTATKPTTEPQNDLFGYLDKQLSMHQLPSLGEMQAEKVDLVACRYNTIGLSIREFGDTPNVYCLDVVETLGYIKQIDPDHVYTVKKLQYQDTEYYAYSVHRRETWGSGIVREYWSLNPIKANLNYYVFEIYFVSTNLSSLDFESITKGCGAEAVVAIDVTAKLMYESAPDDFTSYHLLNDGLLILEYECTASSFDFESYTVFSKTFYPYGTQDPAAAQYKILQVSEPIELPA